MGKGTKLLAAFSVAASLGGLPLKAEYPVKDGQDKFNLAVECIKRFEGWHSNHLPYIGYGHRLLPGEQLTPDISERQADSLLRTDLRKLCILFRRFGKDSLLLATLAYNVGPYRLLGYGKIPKSRLIMRLESGNRDIYVEYISFRCYKGKILPSIERRRKKEYDLLYIQ